MAFAVDDDDDDAFIYPDPSPKRYAGYNNYTRHGAIDVQREAAKGFRQ
jgi:hypothetical protein